MQLQSTFMNFVTGKTPSYQVYSQMQEQNL